MICLGVYVLCRVKTQVIPVTGVEGAILGGILLVLFCRNIVLSEFRLAGLFCPRCCSNGGICYLAELIALSNLHSRV